MLVQLDVFKTLLVHIHVVKKFKGKIKIHNMGLTAFSNHREIN